MLPGRFHSRLLLLLILAPIMCSHAVNSLVESQQDFVEQRAEMVRRQLQARDIHHPGVLRAMGEVARHLFVPESMRPFAYGDGPLPIGLNQTISQPYIVALMTQMVDPQAGDRVLEVGTGSGYQAAVLSSLVERVFSIEIVPELAESAGRRMRTLGYENVTVIEGDGYAGLPAEAPFDIIMVTAAAPRIPEPLVEQLADKGRMAIPVGAANDVQILTQVERRGDRITRKAVLAVRFVPMTGRIEIVSP
jgi:protein-L-isoaspartate(D-aspartate) O-methyltransferase